MINFRTKGHNCGFIFTTLYIGKKSTLYEVKCLTSGDKFYHIVENSNKKYPAENWPERINDLTKIKINKL